MQSKSAWESRAKAEIEWPLSQLSSVSALGTCRFSFYRFFNFHTCLSSWSIDFTFCWIGQQAAANSISNKQGIDTRPRPPKRWPNCPESTILSRVTIKFIKARGLHRAAPRRAHTQSASTSESKSEPGLNSQRWAVGGRREGRQREGGSCMRAHVWYL